MIGRPSRTSQRPCVECPSRSCSFCLVTPTTVKCICIAMQSVSRTFLSCKTETQYLLNNFPFSLPPRPSHRPFYFLFLWTMTLERSHKWNHIAFKKYYFLILKNSYNAIWTYSPSPNLYNNHPLCLPILCHLTLGFLLSPLSSVYVVQLVLGVGSAGGCGLPVRSHIVKGNWLFVSQNLSNTNRSSASEEISCLPFPCVC